MLPDFIGIGPTKTATTWLFNCLREHPQLFMPAGKETQFFVNRHYAGDLSAYEAFFVEAGDAAAVGEISPRYFSHPDAPQRIAEHMPQVKLIVTLRDPVKRLESDYWHHRRQNVDVGERAKNNMPDTLAAALQSHANALIEPSLYATHLKRWLELFDRAQVHIIISEDIRATPNAVVADLFEFLGVDRSFVPEALTDRGAAARKGVSARSPMMGRIYQTVYTILIRGVYRPLRKTIGLKRASAFKDAVGARQLMSAVFHKQGYPAMAPETAAKLRAQFEPEVRELEALIGRDLSAWRSA